MELTWQAQPPEMPVTNGQIYAFVPAHSGSNADVFARQLSRQLAQSHGLSVLLSDFSNTGMTGQPAEPHFLDYARSKYQITCADLSEARESAALEVLRSADSIFLVANSDGPSIEQARYRAAWLRSMLRSVQIEDRTALLLNRIPGGIGGAEAEDRTGLPVCATLDRPGALDRLADWLAAPLLAAGISSPSYQSSLRAG